MSELLSMRLDKWLWCARFYKTRSLAVEEINKGRVSVNGSHVKPAREVKVGDQVSLRQGGIPRVVVIHGLSGMRGPAPVAQKLYAETAESLLERQQMQEQRRIAPEPADSIRGKHEGRPTKRDRRHIDEARSAWGARWSASIEDQ